MKKKRLGILILGLVLILAGTIFAFEQTLTVNILPPTLEILSPLSNQVYQTNTIPLIIKINDNRAVKNIWIIDSNSGKGLEHLCTNCQSYNQPRYFSDGFHTITIKVDFDDSCPGCGQCIEKTVSFLIDSKSSIYINQSGVLKKASYRDLINYLLYVDFNLVHKNDYLPDDSCSIRANKGTAFVNGKNFGNLNKLNFYTIGSLNQGQFELTTQSNRAFVSFKFKLENITENSETTLRVLISDKKTKKLAVLELDKASKKVNIIGTNFNFTGLEAYFTDGCSMEKKNFYFLINKGLKKKDISEVRKILTENPIFIAMHENLKFLFTPSWKLKIFFS